MGNVFVHPERGNEEKRKYMKSPELIQSPEAIAELVSELGRHQYAGIVSIGPVGVGKSSNLNTIASYMSNQLQQQAPAGTGTSSLTKDKQTHIISYQGRPVKWKWMDTPGDLFTGLVETWKQTEFFVEGNDNTTAQTLTMAQYSTHLNEVLLRPMVSHQIGCVMAFLSASEVAANTTKDERGHGVRLRVSPGSRLAYNLQVLKDLYRQLVHSGLRMITILTKADLVDPAVQEDVAEVQYSETVHHLRECVARETGMPLNQVHIVVNLVTDFSPMDNLPLGHLALFNVRCALSAALHSATAPQAPPNSATPEWDTLTFPSSITGPDGCAGRSHAVKMAEPEITPRSVLPPSEIHLPDDVKSVAYSQLTDIDEHLIQESASESGRTTAENNVDDDAQSSF